MLVDGVKILHPDGWALVLPDPEAAVTHVWAEGDDRREARRLVSGAAPVASPTSHPAGAADRPG